MIDEKKRERIESLYARSRRLFPEVPELTVEELDGLRVEVSVLTPSRALDRPQDIVLGRDGVVLRKGSAGAVFLPMGSRINRVPSGIWDATSA